MDDFFQFFYFTCRRAYLKKNLISKDLNSMDEIHFFFLKQEIFQFLIYNQRYFL